MRMSDHEREQAFQRFKDRPEAELQELAMKLRETRKRDKLAIIEQIIEIKLTVEEQAALQKSADAVGELKELLKKLS